MRSLTVLERRFWSRGYTRIAGVDEAGRGPLAGPVVAACVVLPPMVELPGVRDSKRLTPACRCRLLEQIRAVALDIGVGVVDVETIDSINILRATHLAMRRSLANLRQPPEHILVDGRALPDLPHPQTPLIKGDDRCLSIASASIVAKVFRDRMMVELDHLYPHYGFARHKGYGTPEHLECLRRLGPCPVHRRTFHPVSDFPCRG